MGYYGGSFLEGFSSSISQFLPYLAINYVQNKQDKADRLNLLTLNSAIKSGDPGSIALAQSAYTGNKLGAVKALPVNSYNPSMAVSSGGYSPLIQQSSAPVNSVEYNNQRIAAIAPAFKKEASQNSYRSLAGSAFSGSQSRSELEMMKRMNIVSGIYKRFSQSNPMLANGFLKQAGKTYGLSDDMVAMAVSPEFSQNKQQTLGSDMIPASQTVNAKGDVSTTYKPKEDIKLGKPKTAKEFATVLNGQKTQEGLLSSVFDFFKNPETKEAEKFKAYDDLLKTQYPDQYNNFTEDQKKAGFYATMSYYKEYESTQETTRLEQTQKKLRIDKLKKKNNRNV